MTSRMERDILMQVIPPQIREIALQNPLIQQILEQYLNGNICTREEMLCQMIVMLNKDWIEQRKHYRKYVAAFGTPFGPTA